MKRKNCDSCQQKENCSCSGSAYQCSPQTRLLRFIFAIILIGLIGPFIAQCCLSVFNSDANIKGLEMWNQYVGIILGIVATVLSIVSLNMGFQSAAEASAQQRKASEQYEATLQLMTQLEGKVERIGDKMGVKTESSVTLKANIEPLHTEQPQECTDEEENQAESSAQGEQLLSLK